MGLSKLYIKTILIVVIYYDENETRFDCIALGNHCNYDKILILQIVTKMARRTTAQGENLKRSWITDTLTLSASF